MRDFIIYRYHPTVDEKPYLGKYSVNIEKENVIMVLDALNVIKNQQDSTLTYRRSCREAICGSCSINLNGLNTLACVAHLPKGNKPIKIYPLPHTYVIKDLVPDVNHLYEQYYFTEPYIVNKESDKPMTENTKEFFQSKSDRLLLDGLYECVLCFSCSSACPSYYWNSDLFLGPSALLQAYRWIIDSRDENKEARLEKLRKNRFTLYRCHVISNCTKVCPKHLNPAGAIAKIKSLAH